jgi:hypothetical protein
MIEQMLRSTSIDWPPTPDLVPAVADAIAVDGADRRPAAPHRVRRAYPWRIRRPLAIAIAALLLLAATAAAIPGIREPVLDWLGLRSVHVERVPRPLPEPPGSKLDLGERTTLAKARANLAFTPVVAAGLGEPTVWYDGFPPGGQLSLVYRGGILVSEVQGQLERDYLFKFLQPGTGVTTARVNGERALWIEGPHQYAYADRTGALRTDSVRTTGPVLLWRRGELLIRLEGARTKARALAIARAMR